MQDQVKEGQPLNPESMGFTMPKTKLNAWFPDNDVFWTHSIPYDAPPFDARCASPLFVEHSKPNRIDGPLSSATATVHPIQEAETHEHLWRLYAASRDHAVDASKPGAAWAEGQRRAHDDEQCHHAEHANPDALDFGEFCTAGEGCWPAVWLLGAQKASSTAVYVRLKGCGIVADASNIARAIAGPVSESDYVGSDCKGTSSGGCKESHFLAKTRELVDSAQLHRTSYEPYSMSDIPGGAKRVLDFTRMYDHDSCSGVGGEACTQSRFIEATPSTGDVATPKLLAAIMPHRLLTKARFLLVLREPTERLLSWYNHQRSPDAQIYDHRCFRRHLKTTFDEYARCLHGEHGYTDGDTHHGDSGITTADYLRNLLDNTPVSRKQLLMVSYEQVTTNTTLVMHAISRHIGGPILDQVTELPEVNAHASPGKITQIKCSTRGYLSSVYAPMLKSLYARLDNDKRYARAPPYEPPFAPLNVRVECGDAEKAGTTAWALKEL